MTDTRFRKLLWVYVALLVAAITSIFLATYSETLAVAYDNEPASWLMSNLWASGGLVGVIAAAWLIGLVGLFCFKSWARPLALYATLASFVVNPFLGVSLSSGLESALFEATATIWGAILALSYFSSISGRFGR